MTIIAIAIFSPVIFAQAQTEKITEAKFVGWTFYLPPPDDTYQGKVIVTVEGLDKHGTKYSLAMHGALYEVTPHTFSYCSKTTENFYFITPNPDKFSSLRFDLYKTNGYSTWLSHEVCHIDPVPKAERERLKRVGEVGVEPEPTPIPISEPTPPEEGKAWIDIDIDFLAPFEYANEHFYIPTRDWVIKTWDTLVEWKQSIFPDKTHFESLDVVGVDYNNSVATISYSITNSTFPTSYTIDINKETYANLKMYRHNYEGEFEYEFNETEIGTVIYVDIVKGFNDTIVNRKDFYIPTRYEWDICKPLAGEDGVEYDSDPFKLGEFSFDNSMLKDEEKERLNKTGKEDNAMLDAAVLGATMATGMIEMFATLISNYAVLTVLFAVIAGGIIASSGGPQMGVIAVISIMAIGCALKLLPMWFITVIILFAVAVIAFKVSKIGGGG